MALKEERWDLDIRTEEKWLFNQAPRYMRAEGVAYIPDLMEALVDRAQVMIKKVEQSQLKVRQYVAALDETMIEVINGKAKTGG